jgi:hypothetical protein
MAEDDGNLEKNYIRIPGGIDVALLKNRKKEYCRKYLGLRLDRKRGI